jgi:hypothetical protein
MAVAAQISRERAVEKAWRRHEPLRAKVPYPARRAAEQFRESIVGDAERVRLTYQSKPFRRILADWAKAASLGRSHAIHRVAAALSPACVDVIDGALRLMWLEAHAERLTLIDDPRYDQPAVLVVGALVRRTGRALGAANGFPCVEVSEHALRRIFERAPGTDVKAALLQSAHSFLSADYRTVEEKRLRGDYISGADLDSFSVKFFIAQIAPTSRDCLAAPTLGSAGPRPSPASGPWRRLRRRRPQC